MGTDCTTAPPAAIQAAGPSRVAARLRVGVRHAATSLCVRIACLPTATSTPAQDMEHGMAQVLAAADRLLLEAGSHRHRILLCELFVREPALTAEARRILDAWMAGGLARPHVVPPAVHAHSQAGRAPAMPGHPAAAPLVEMAMVVAHRADSGAV